MTVIGKIRYYQGRVAYPQPDALREAVLRKDLIDEEVAGSTRKPTEDSDCTHVQVISVSGDNAEQARSRAKESLDAFFDYVGYKRGFRVLTHETTTDSNQGRVRIEHEIVYVIESRPTKGYVKLTLKPKHEPRDDQRFESAVADAFSPEGMADFWDNLQPKKKP